MIEGGWLCLVLVLPNLKRLEEDKLFYDEDLRFSSPKTVETFFPGICYPLKLPNGFQNSSRKSAHC